MSFDYGLSLGADGLEFDVRLSRDGVVVVHHDATLERTTNGRGALSSYTADELSHVDAGHWFSPADATRKPGEPDSFPYRGQGHGIPRPKQVLSRYPGVPLIIELKVNDPDSGATHDSGCPRGGAVDVSALDRLAGACCGGTGKLEPRIPTGASREEVRLALYRSWIRWPLGKEAYQEFQVPETLIGSDAGRVQAFHRARAPRRPAGQGLDRQRPRRHAAAPRLGR